MSKAKLVAQLCSSLYSEDLCKVGKCEYDVPICCAYCSEGPYCKYLCDKLTPEFFEENED